MERYEGWSYESKDKEGRKVDDICPGTFVLDTIVNLPEVLYVLDKGYLTKNLAVWIFAISR